MCVSEYYQLQIGTYHGHLPLLNHELLQLLTFNTSWKEFRVENRNEALCALGKTGRTGLQIIRYFQELILWAQFLYLFISKKCTKILRGEVCSLWLAVTFVKLAKPAKNMCLNCTPSSPKSHICWLIFPPPLWSSFSEHQDAVSWTTSLILPQIKLNSQFSCFAFFYVNKNIYLSRKSARLGKYPARSCLQAGRPLFSNQAKE